ncbi:MAG: hypothetical protein COU27_03120 [Candidatus Levybacteria bacterium CG10_big_fil_rev_8_21_14_0_10_36_7]|nr:MAG: hypothetical protein COU27_03120 [Candidatus Levybacteria bacterium CG10_big_fil_rev_8_21_14_0_10_36_7]
MSTPEQIPLSLDKTLKHISKNQVVDEKPKIVDLDKELAGIKTLASRILDKYGQIRATSIFSEGRFIPGFYFQTPWVEVELESGNAELSLRSDPHQKREVCAVFRSNSAEKNLFNISDAQIVIFWGDKINSLKSIRETIEVVASSFMQRE